MCLFMWFLDMNPLHTENIDMEFPSMTVNVSLWVVPGDEALATQSTMIWILLIMNCCVSI